MPRNGQLQPGELPEQHPTAVAFLDESGSISNDRFFTVGCLKLTEPSVLLRSIQTLRDKWHWYQEIHFNALTKNSLSFYRAVVGTVAATPDCVFRAFVADRNIADPIARFGTPWLAYEKLATQLLLASIKPKELLAVLADNYSTPPHVVFEQDVKYAVNRRLGRLGVTKVVRLDSKAADPLQVVDLLTSAVAREFRESAGLANSRSPKGQLASYLRQTFHLGTFLKGCKTAKISVAIHEKKNIDLLPGAGKLT